MENIKLSMISCLHVVVLDFISFMTVNSITLTVLQQTCLSPDNLPYNNFSIVSYVYSIPKRKETSGWRCMKTVILEVGESQKSPLIVVNTEIYT